MTATIPLYRLRARARRELSTAKAWAMCAYAAVCVALAMLAERVWRR